MRIIISIWFLPDSGTLSLSCGTLSVVSKVAICIMFGQSIATSRDRFSPNAGLVREIPLFQGNLGWWNIIIGPDYVNIRISMQ